MKQQMYNFFEKAPLWQVYIFGIIFTGSFMTSLFYGFQYIEPEASKLLGFPVCLKIGFTVGLVFGLLVMLMTSMMRKSVIFWNYAKVVEGLIEEAKTNDELDSIFKNEFKELIRCANGGPQGPELSRIYTIMKTKYKYMTPENKSENK